MQTFKRENSTSSYRKVVVKQNLIPFPPPCTLQFVEYTIFLLPAVQQLVVLHTEMEGLCKVVFR